jgi:hypothetical protein
MRGARWDAREKRAPGGTGSRQGGNRTGQLTSHSKVKQALPRLKRDLLWVAQELPITIVVSTGDGIRSEQVARARARLGIGFYDDAAVVDGILGEAGCCLDRLIREFTSCPVGRANPDYS